MGTTQDSSLYCAIVLIHAQHALDFLHSSHHRDQVDEGGGRWANGKGKAVGFRKVATSRWEFCNDMFRKGERELLRQIRRRKAWTNKQQPIAPLIQATPQEFEEDQRSSSTLSSSEYTSLVDENKRLKKENGVLSTELTSMKRKCKELLDLVAKSAHLEKEEEDERPKLFGVRLEVEGEREKKRKRAEIRESATILLSQSCK
ncbi:hypothetical protein D5086_012175 [Populus alba]|uniref:Uncharacterized protein n=1 Tax=Populus alba TaxID=43335 RepID=A0ACC4C242_POPAL